MHGCDVVGIENNSGTQKKNSGTQKEITTDKNEIAPKLNAIKKSSLQREKLRKECLFLNFGFVSSGVISSKVISGSRCFRFLTHIIYESIIIMNEEKYFSNTFNFQRTVYEAFLQILGMHLNSEIIRAK